MLATLANWQTKPVATRGVVLSRDELCPDVLSADVSSDVGIHASIVLSGSFLQAQLPNSPTWRPLQEWMPADRVPLQQPCNNQVNLR